MRREDLEVFDPSPDKGARLFQYGVSFTSQWHGLIKVQDSSAQGDICGWIFGADAFSDNPNPHLHLTIDDMRQLRDRLTLFLEINRKGRTR